MEWKIDPKLIVLVACICYYGIFKTQRPNRFYILVKVNGVTHLLEFKNSYWLTIQTPVLYVY